MKVVSVINYKGGVGKTTVTSNLAAYVASKSKRVLAIDVDPQTNLTFSFIDDIEWEKKYAQNKTLRNFFDPISKTGEKKVSLEDLIIPIEIGGFKLDIISSHLELINVDIDLAANLAAPNLPMLATKYLEAHNYLREEIEKLKEKYDLILIDCPPSFNLVTKNALVASDQYLTPSKMDYLSAFGVQQLTRHIKGFLEQYNQYMQTTKGAVANPEFLGIVATMVGVYGGGLVAANKLHWENLKSVGYEIFDSFIKNNTYFVTAPSSNIPVVLSKATPANINIIEELQKLGDEFIEKAMI